MTAPTIDLARREGVELVRTGRWETMTGSWTPTVEDIAAAVEAQSCPAVRKPVVKLGHTDARFAVGDGEPALGWFENLRATDGGSTLIGDQVTLPWLHSVQAAAYPSRSIEGNYNHRCGAGHVHKFVLTAVALLGVTPPAVKTIRNLNDLPAMLGVAASDPEIPEGAERVQVTVMARRRADDFNESSAKRDTGGKFARIDTNDGPGGHGLSTGGSSSATSTGGSGASKPAAPLKDTLKIGDRISLRDGETVTGGVRIEGTDSHARFAVVDSPAGRRLHLGLNPPDDDIAESEGGTAWSGNRDEWTTVVDEAGIAALRDAIPAMAKMGAEGKRHLKALDKISTDLEKRERDLVNSQYPGLTAAGKKELARLDAKISDLDDRLGREQDRHQQRIDRLNADDRQQVARADAASARQAYTDAYLAAHPDEQNTASTYGWLFERGVVEQESLVAEKTSLTARRQELTGDPQPLSPEAQTQLSEVRDAYARHESEIGDFIDESYLTDGVVPGEWGDVVWQAVMTDTGPRYSLSVRPLDAPADWRPSVEGATTDFDDAGLKKLGALMDKIGGTQTVKAAAEAHTGAMIALIPTVEDAARLAVDGGEPAEQLHVTLAYLGKAADLGAAGQQDVIDAVSSAANGLPVIEAEGFSLNVFNPPGAARDDGKDRDSCIVLGMSGDWLDMVHTLVGEALWQVPTPQQHRPWHAHMTLIYTDDLSRLAGLVDRVGPVSFDRIRLAFAGQHIDIPLIGEPEDLEPDGDDVQAAAGDGKDLKRYWLGEGLKRWASAKHPWTTLYRLLKRHITNEDKLRRTVSDWYREHFGHMPSQRMKVAAAEGPPDAVGPPTTASHTPTPPGPGGVSVSPAAEPDPSTTEEDMVSTLNADLRQALGLADDVDDAGVLAKVGELKSRAEKPPPAEPTPEQVAASAAADEKRAELEKEVAALSSRMAEVTSELAAAKAEKVETVKASVLNAAIKDGKIKPADKDQWSKDYDEAPGVTTRVLASIAPGTAVPVMAAGHTGPAEPDAIDPNGISDDELNAWASQLGVDPKELANG